VSKTDDKSAFEKAIAADPYDMSTRKVYADWLDEFGTDADADKAAEQRAWTKEKQDAIVWLTDFAKDLCDDDSHPRYGDDPEYNTGYTMTYERLIRAATGALDNGEYCHLDFNTPDRCYDEIDTFWAMYELATGRSVDDSKKTSFFSCSC
jgi:uncharacterized protein (TIGR02996 family)